MDGVAHRARIKVIRPRRQNGARCLRALLLRRDVSEGPGICNPLQSEVLSQGNGLHFSSGHKTSTAAL